MSMQTENVSLIDEIIENASELPLECQDWILAIAKGMVFTKGCLSRQIQKNHRKALIFMAGLSAAEDEEQSSDGNDSNVKEG